MQLFESDVDKKIVIFPRHDYGHALVPFSNCFSSTRKRKASIFKFLQFKKRVFENLRFVSWRIRVDSRGNRGNKTSVFSLQIRVPRKVNEA